jgi:hypothetical protein
MESVAKMFARINEIKKKEERIEALKQNNNLVVRSVVAGWFDPNIKFALPEGAPPYKPSKFDEPKALLAEVPRFYLLTENGNPNLKPAKRELIFIQMLEVVNAEDAELLISMKDKKCPYKGITKDVVMAAFPGLIPE